MKYFEDFEVGDVYVSRGRTITEADIVNFAAFSGDWYPLHVDKEYAAKSPFGERIAHGMLVLSAASGLMPLTDYAIVAFYGMDRVRFVGPTKIGDTIHVEAEVTEKKEKSELGGVVTFQQKIVDQEGKEKAVATFKIFMASRPK
ncbi:MAG: MaoC family dehydratase N-terminal domain-containing protein [Actinobacteria bacterium]|nr:MaoC family dehydratase N-terminal domain-containing protein [Actinomycetota bacterium]MDI6830168.1 MaoC/PaaZ C-terminal domain-containing protein [Actinomycetota bacterium]